MPKATLTFDLEHPGEKRDTAEIKRRLGMIPGVTSVSVGRGRDRVAVDYDTTGTGPDELRNRLTACGCRIAAEHGDDHTM